VPGATPLAGKPLFDAFVTGPSAVATGVVGVGAGVGVADAVGDGSVVGAGAGPGAPPPATGVTMKSPEERLVPTGFTARIRI
jgi:hypothetical protein